MHLHIATTSDVKSIYVRKGKYYYEKNSFILSLGLIIGLTACNAAPISSSSSSSSSSVSNSSEGVVITKDSKGTATIKISKDNQFSGTDRYLSPKDVELKYTYGDLNGTLSNNENVCPSTGDVNLLVIPVHLPGGDAYKTDAVKEDIKTAFFSKEDKTRMGTNSLTEYFNKSSYGKLNFQGTVTDWFDVTEHTTIDSADDVTAGSSGTIISEILRNAASWAKETQGIDLKDYDKNDDGSIDAVWLVYDHLDWSTEYALNLKADPTYNGSGLNSAFWNFTSWDFGTDRNTVEGNDPTTSAFSWASFDMLYTSYAKHDDNDVPDITDLSSIMLDTHTFIHETGHLLGLDDYYASDNSNYHPAGKSTMMDLNICDLDSYSKMLLGWVTPFVVYGTSEILIPTATSSDHSVIVIPSDFASLSDTVQKRIDKGTIDSFVYSFNPFSEYMMIDLYSPDGLNEQDTYGEYIYGRDPGMSKTGVRIYHIDSRIFKCSVINYDGGQKLSYTDGYVWDGGELEDNEAILMPISNQKTESTSFQLPESFNYYDQIRLLEATKINSFDSNNYATNYTLFDMEKSFSIGDFGYQFFHANYAYNDGNELPFIVSVSTLKGIE